MIALPSVLLITTLAAIAIFALVLVGPGSEKADDIWFEVARASTQVIVIGVLGTVLKFLLDEQQATRQRLERAETFRRDKIQRLIAVTNRLRKVPVLIEAHRSAKTWGEQMRVAIDAKQAIGFIRHEVGAGGSSADAPFPNADDISAKLRSMEAHLEVLSRDYRAFYKDLSEQQRGAEDSKLKDADRQARQAAIWDRIQEIPSTADLLSECMPSAWETMIRTYKEAVELMIKASQSPSVRETAERDRSRAANR